jgi:apolipoprotein D and lipocalin family protein
MKLCSFGKSLVGVLAVLLLFSGCAGPGQMRKPLKPVTHVDLQRYMGDWYVYANIPYFAEKGCYNSVESYALRPDGRIDNGFRYRKGSFQGPEKKVQALAWVQNRESNAEWRVRFFGVFTAEYWVIDLDPQYRWAVVGHPSRNYGWVLSRSKTLKEQDYTGILNRLKAQGYDANRFVKVPQG